MNELQRKTGEKSAIAAGETVAAVSEKPLKGEIAETSQKDEKPVDYRYVPHGHGPCNCCGPYSE